MITWPILTLSIVLILCSIALALFILLHKGRGGGLSDLFGGGMSTSMGGKSVAERNLDKLTITVAVIWLACILGLLAIYRFAPTLGELGVEETPAATATETAGTEEASESPEASDGTEASDAASTPAEETPSDASETPSE
jgi:preprotein translocase subunit SecG